MGVGSPHMLGGAISYNEWKATTNEDTITGRLFQRNTTHL